MNHAHAAAYDLSHFFAGLMLVTSFVLIYQDRMLAVLRTFAVQAVLLSVVVAWEAWVQERPHLFITAALAFALKGIVIPLALHRMIFKLDIHRDVEKVVSVGMTMLFGLALTTLSFMLVLKATAASPAFAREGLAIALAIILLGLLMMITRRNALTQIIGFMSIENGLILGATGARGMPLVVEISVAFSVLIVLFVFAVFVFRIRERFDTVDVAALERVRGDRMNPVVHAVIGIPFAAAIVLAALPGYRLASAANIFASLLTLFAGLALLGIEHGSANYLIVDDVNIVFIVLNTLVGFTAVVFSASYIGHELESGRLSPGSVRFYHAMYQAMMGSMNVALLADNIGLLWVGLEMATLITVVMVGLYRTPQAIEAAWKYFILGSVGISLAFFGTILVYLAGQAALGEGFPAMSWQLLHAHAGELDVPLLNLGFVFLLIGYGTKIGLAPLHAWLPDAHSEGPTPISAVLSGLLLNVALFALLRFKMLIGANPQAMRPGPILVVMGLLSLIFAAFMLYRRRDIKRLFAYSSIEHMGLITFAFGMGGALANFAGLLHMTLHSLTKSAIFFVVGHIAQAKGTQTIADIRGLSVTHPGLAAGLGLGVLAICGLPPFGLFMSEFLLLTTTFARAPWLAVLVALALVIAFAALLLRTQQMLFGAPSTPTHPAHASRLPFALHLSLVLLMGVYLPDSLVQWFQRAAEFLN